jgi:hypothetical protein
MPLLWKLFANVVAVVLVGSAIAAYAGVSIFPLTPEQTRALWVGLLVAVPAECAAVGLALANKVGTAPPFGENGDRTRSGGFEGAKVFQ